MSPVFAHGQLRLYLLALLADGPRHGYEVIQELEARFDGLYSPSAGTIYPRLAKLEDEGLLERTDEGRKATYRITEAGRAEVAARSAELADLRAGLDQSVRQLAEQVRATVHGRAADLRAELKAAARSARAGARPTGSAASGPPLSPTWVAGPEDWPPPPADRSASDATRAGGGSSGPVGEWWADWLADWPSGDRATRRSAREGADDEVPGRATGFGGLDALRWAGPELERAARELRDQAAAAWRRHGVTPEQSAAVAEIVTEATRRIAEVLRQPPTDR